MENSKATLLSKVANYYSRKLQEHGETPNGVDWNSEQSQVLRFEQLCRVLEGEAGPIAINDLGCGYGAMLDHLTSGYEIASYLGIDVSKEMIQAARKRYDLVSNARFINASEPDQNADYGIASGIFNVRLKNSDDEWAKYIKYTLDVLNKTSRTGFAFNCLTSYSDSDKMRDNLFYADPCEWFDFCKKRYSRNVALLHDYHLYEFTILVRK